MLKTRCILLLLCLLSLLSAHAQDFSKAKMDSFFDLLAEKNKAMGSIAIAKNGKVVYSRAIGYSVMTASHNTPATTATKYRIGSITKMFTAVMIFQLVEEGRLKLTTTLDTWFPQLPDAKVITIGNMLNHRSGLHSVTDDSTYLQWNTQPKTHEELVSLIANSKPEFEPNTKSRYSNSNYILLGYIIEKVTKKSYAKNLELRITSKLGLKDTYVGSKTNTASNESYSYQYAGQWKQESETDMSIPGGAGANVSTPSDLTRFIDALFSLKLISKESLQQMKTMTDGMGMGMFVYPLGNKTAYGHNGGIDAFASNVAYFPEDSVAIAYCTNGEVYSMNDLLIAALKIYFNKPYTLPTFKTWR